MSQQLSEGTATSWQELLKTKDPEFAKVFQIPALKAAFKAFCSTRKVDGMYTLVFKCDS